MRDTTLKIALAGLMHDIGKFCQGSLPVSREYLNNNAGLYQPFRDGHHTHVHAVYTAAFIEKMADVLHEKLNSPNWGEGDSFINLAAGHHRPSSPMQWIVTTADRISSGLDRRTFDHGEKVAIKDVKKTRLLPVLEYLGPERCEQFSSKDHFKYAYTLAPLSAHTIFPQKMKGLERDQAEQEYEALFHEFCDRIPALLHRHGDIELWSQHLDSLLMVYTSMVPAARVGDVVFDVSLYDHCRSTAALAAALYQYHAVRDQMDEQAIKDGKTEKFLLISGDFYGIQAFIFNTSGESRRFRSKLLRGRSFAVSLFSELAASFICKRLKLPFLSVLLNAAGKFHIIAPNLPETMEVVLGCERHINDWLFSMTYGESSLGIACTPACQDDFTQERFHAFWGRHLGNLERRKYTKIDIEHYGGAIEGFLDQFDNTLASPLCPLCGKRPSVKEAENDPVFGLHRTSSCALCRDHVFLGTNLVKGDRIAIFSSTHDTRLNPTNSILEPVFGEFQVTFPRTGSQYRANEDGLIALWETGIGHDGSLACNATVKLINGYVPCFHEEDNYDDCLLESAKKEQKLEELIDQVKEGGIKTFHHIAVKARHKQESDKECHGVEALGVLKADVDNLGMLFGCGLTEGQFTLSRLATLSRQLNNFFTLYLPHLLGQTRVYQDVYTVFAGGDDLFLIGPWNAMAGLSAKIRSKFREYVCDNPLITISAGITVHKPNTPVDRMAHCAEEALGTSKSSGKDSITMFGETVTWDAFQELLTIRSEMEDWLQHGYFSSSMLYRLNQLIAMAQKEASLSGALASGEKRTISLSDMECFKWRSMFWYHLARNLDKGLKDRDKVMEEVGNRAAVWLKEFRGAVRIPLWHVLYNIRI